MFAEIIPFARLPKKLSYFDYEVPQEMEKKIKMGQIVEIFFRGKKMSGAVRALKEKPALTAAPIKPLGKILDEGINLDETRLKFLEWLSGYYLVSPALTAKTFLPEPPRRVRGKNAVLTAEPPPAGLSVAKSDLEEMERQVKRIVSSEKTGFLIHYNNHKNKVAVLLKITEKLISSGKGTLLLSPQVPDIASLRPYFISIFKDKTAELHGELSKTAYWREWKKIRSGSAQIVFGTRSALFAPLQRVGLIIVDDEEASDFKQSDQNPRYDARDAAIRLGELSGAKVIFTSQSPRPEAFFSFQNSPHAEYFPPAKNERAVAELVDMSNEVRNKNFSPISGVLKNKISLALKAGRRVILILNRRGLSTTVICRDCGYVFLCKNCRMPLACHDDECSLSHGFVCHNCGSLEPARLVCPKCNGASIKYVGVGTQAVEKEIKKAFPRSKVLRVDKDTPEPNLARSVGTADIFIGTQFLIRNYLHQINNIGLLGIVSADNLFYRPDFRSGEKTFSWLAGMVNLARRNKSGLVVQTFLPDNFVIQAAISENREKFYLEELSNRQEIGYPPFGKLIKLAYASLSEKDCSGESEKIGMALEKALGKTVTISISSKPRKERNKFFCKIILRFQEEISDIVKETIVKIVSDSWTIDIDPESVL